MKQLIAIAATLFILISFIPLSQAGTPIEGPGEGDTSIGGYSEREDSAFAPSLNSDIWYPNLNLYIYSGTLNRTYRIRQDHTTIREGRFEDSNWYEFQINLTEGERIRLEIQIGEYIYEFNPIVSQQAIEDEGWDPEEEHGPYDESDLTRVKQSAWFQAIIGFGIVLVVSHRIAKIKKEYNIEPVIE